MDDANANATVGRRATGLGEKEEPRRSKSKRDRKKVTLLSSEYSTIYDDANNRKKKEPDKKKEDLQIQQTLALSLTQPKSKPKSTIKKKKGKADVSSAATYRWIGKGKMREGNGNELCFDAVEIQVGGHPALIEVGDNVLISSHDTEESEVFDKSASTVNRNQYLNGGENLDKTKIPMNGLAPFVGKVESLWEVDIGGGVAAGKKKNSSDAKSNVNDVVKGGDARSNRMKVLIRWYYKKADLAPLGGKFEGISRQVILSHLTSRDLLLSETSDENHITTILGKCRVLRRKPGPLKPDSSKDAAEKKSMKRSREGAFACNFDIAITVAKKPKVTITPYSGPDEQEDDIPTSKRSRQNGGDNSYAAPNDASGAFAAEALLMDETNDDSSLDEHIKSPGGNKTPTTEGSATQKIGENHQAVIPSLAYGEPRTASKRDAPPTLMWRPHCISTDDLDKFIAEAGAILKAFMKDKGIITSRTIPINIDPKHLQSNFFLREINVDQLLKLLNDKGFETQTALKAIRASPLTYLMIWTKEEIELYNAGFKRHFSAIRSITKDMGSTKNHKEVVDYHYRFKIPDQFRRYQDKKREQARRMLDCVEKHRLEEYLPTESAQASTIGTKKINNWSRTGGGPTHSIGSVESRRLGAKDFLVALKDTVGVTDYLILLDHLKSLHLRVITIPQCRKAFESHLADYPNLMIRFDEYLPKRFR